MAPAAPAEEPPAKEDHDFWTDFVEAEECADGGFDAILTACGDALYAKYLSNKAFKFAAQTATDIMVAHLRMCFVEHDHGDMDAGDDDWKIEAEVPCSSLDSWCRRVVPIENREQKPAPEKKKSPMRARKKAAAEEEVDDKKKGKGEEHRPVKLPKPVLEEDEYEDILRRHFLSVEKRKKEQDDDRKKREAEEMELKRQNEKFREELAKKEITYDSKGAILFVDQKPSVTKLPPTILSTGYKQKSDEPPSPDPKPKQKGASRGTASRAKPKKARKPKLKEAPEFPDSFSRLTTLQPPAYEIMQLIAGSELEEMAKTKRGPPLEYREGIMTRTAYKILCEEDKAATSETGNKNALLGGSEDVGSDEASMSQSDAFNLEIVRMDPAMWGKNPPLLEQDLRKSTGPSPPATHDWAQKREAVGNLGMHPRDRVAELGSTSGWRLPQPPLGATMGHGLLRGSATGREELHYFPAKTSALSPRDQRNLALGMSPEHSARPDQLPPLANAPSLPNLAQTQGSNWMGDPGVLDVRFARSHSGGAITSSKTEMLKSMVKGI
jgi:hypothetical protein